jgi:hypothetical protein
MSIKTKSSYLVAKIIIFLLVVSLAAGAYFYRQYKLSVPPPVTIVEKEIIYGFPDFPIYPEAEIKSSQRTEKYGLEPISYQAYMDSHDSVLNIIKWYKDTLTEEGWTIMPNSDEENEFEQYLTVIRDKTKAVVFAEKEEGESFILIHVQ